MHSTTKHDSVTKHLPRVRALRQVIQKRQELHLLHPGARQCGRCSYGPVTLDGCSDLTTHHGQVMPYMYGFHLDGTSGTTHAPVDNSCPRCTSLARSVHAPCTLPIQAPCTLPPALHQPCTHAPLTLPALSPHVSLRHPNTNHTWPLAVA